MDTAGGVADGNRKTSAHVRRCAIARNYTVSDKLMKARKEAAVAKYGTHSKIEGMARCAGKCRELKPYEEFKAGNRSGKGIQQSWCNACRLEWSEGGVWVTDATDGPRIVS